MTDVGEARTPQEGALAEAEAIRAAIACAHPLTGDDHDAVEQADAQLDSLLAYIKQLEGERDSWQATAEVLEDDNAVLDLFNVEQEERQAAEAENERLREALKEIDALESDSGTYDVIWDGVRQWVPKFKVIARAALAARTGERTNA